MAETGPRAWRRVPPARSPVSVPAVLAAAARAAAPDGTERTLHDVREGLRDRYGAGRCLLTASGTVALTLALRAAMSRSGSRLVALPAYGCFDVATAAAGADARVLLYDVDPHTLGPDLASLEATFRRGARTAVAAHLYGYPVDMPALHGLADRYGALVVEDAAQGAGGELDGRPLGSHGELAVLSFGRGKGWTSGGGGALLAGSRAAGDFLDGAARELAARRRRRGGKEIGTALAQWALGRPGLYRIPASLPFLGLGKTTYRPPGPPEPMAAAAAEILRRTGGRPDPVETDRRREHARRLREGLADAPGADLVEPIPAGRPGELRLPVLLPRAGEACPELGVMPGYPSLLSEIPDFRPFLEETPEPTPGGARLRDRLVTLPTHGHLTPDDLDAVLRWTRRRAAPRRPPAS